MLRLLAMHVFATQITRQSVLLESGLTQRCICRCDTWPIKFAQIALLLAQLVIEQAYFTASVVQIMAFIHSCQALCGIPSGR